MNEGLYSSDRLDWATPQAFFDIVNAEFDFNLDAAASPENAKCERFFTEADDGLSQPWEGVVWCNPPYGRGIANWIKKGFEESRRSPDSSVVMLIPARTDTNYWHEYVMRASEVRLIRGRLVFGQGEALSNAPFPSALVIFEAESSSPVFSSMERGPLQRRAA